MECNRRKKKYKIYMTQALRIQKFGGPMIFGAKCSKSLSGTSSKKHFPNFVYPNFYRLRGISANKLWHSLPFLHITHCTRLFQNKYCDQLFTCVRHLLSSRRTMSSLRNKVARFSPLCNETILYQKLRHSHTKSKVSLYLSNFDTDW